MDLFRLFYVFCSYFYYNINIFLLTSTSKNTKDIALYTLIGLFVSKFELSQLSFYVPMSKMEPIPFVNVVTISTNTFNRIFFLQRTFAHFFLWSLVSQNILGNPTFHSNTYSTYSHIFILTGKHNEQYCSIINPLFFSIISDHN
jgi:hypothetical protein